MKRQFILGALITCLSHTAGSSLAYSKELSSGADLLFGAVAEKPIQEKAIKEVKKIPKIPARKPVSKISKAMNVQNFAAIEPSAPSVISDEPIIAVSEDAPVNLTADQVTYDENNGIVSAVGEVEIVQSGRILRSQKVVYDIPNDRVEAIGDVVLNEVTGEVYFADRVELKDEMKDGFVTSLSGVLVDGSRFKASEAEKIADLKVKMKEASYTACEPCKVNPAKNPLWEIKAKEVTHHKDEQRVTYDDATFEFAGVPVAYTPYFSHSDGTIKRKSGFLMPRVGFDSDLGAIYDQAYYWNIAPDKDATIGAMVMTDQAPLLKGEYRQRFQNAELILDGGITNSDRTDRDNGQEVKEGTETRGHLFVDGIWNINDKWRAGTELEMVSDSQYLRQYNISNEDVLENTVYVERFDGRDYATANLTEFKDIRVSDRKVDQPSVLPQIYSRFLGNPNSLLGGRGSLEISALGLHREGSDQDVARGTVKTGWERRYISDWGLVNNLNLMARADAYEINDGDANIDDNSTARGFANAHWKTSMPFEKRVDQGQVVVEPIGALTLATNLDDNDIPNEDSQDVFLDDTNLFNANRYPGYDRIEDESHATYGIRTGYYADNGHKGEIFLGQSYRFDKESDENQFPEGSGLSERGSDFVGNISVDLGERFTLDYALQLDNDNLSSQRHEIDNSFKIGPLKLGTRYFYANALQGTDLDDSREQIRNSARLNLTDEWSLVGATQYDLAEETEGLRRVSYGLDYQGQCMTFLINGTRRLTRDSSGDSGTTIMMRLGLKNLGEFETSGFSFGSDE